MIITAALCWWNETPEVLATCVRGAANVADRIVALDGAYRRYPGATVRSGDDEVEAIRETAKEVGLDCLVLQPQRLWAGQVEKRSYLLAAAAVGADWVAVIDADHVVYTNRAAARMEIESASADTLIVPYWTPKNPSRSMKESAPGLWHEAQAERWMDIPHIFRVLPGVRVERFHWWYSAIKDRERVWLMGGDGRKYPTVEGYRLNTPYQVNHMCLMRTEAQVLASRAFCNDRAKVVKQTGQEDDIPGLEPLELDYKTRPE